MWYIAVGKYPEVYVQCESQVVLQELEILFVLFNCVILLPYADFRRKGVLLITQKKKEKKLKK